MKIFLDTNVLASAFTTRGLCADLFRTVLAKEQLHIGEVVLKELERVLRDKFHMPKDIAKDIIAMLRDFPVTQVPKQLPVLPLRDRDDIPVIASAIASGAEFLVTGDKELLALRTKLPLRILSPRQMWEVLQGSTK